VIAFLLWCLLFVVCWPVAGCPTSRGFREVGGRTFLIALRIPTRRTTRDRVPALVSSFRGLLARGLARAGPLSDHVGAGRAGSIGRRVRYATSRFHSNQGGR
jgi:hypothetical protein